MICYDGIIMPIEIYKLVDADEEILERFVLLIKFEDLNTFLRK